MEIIQTQEAFYGKHRIVMLPADVSNRHNHTEGLIVKCTKPWTPIWGGGEKIHEGYFSLSFDRGGWDLKYYQPYHLYILSEEPPKKGDICISIGDTFYSHLTVAEHNPRIIKYTGEELGVAKIIASTNDTLAADLCCLAKYGIAKMNEGCREKNRCPFPSIHFSFKVVFIRELNKNMTITEILVEMEEYKVNGMPDEATSFRVKINRNYEVTILPPDYDDIDLYYDTVDPAIIKRDTSYITAKVQDYTALLKEKDPIGQQKIVDEITRRSEEISPEEEREIFTREEVLGFLESFEKLCRDYQGNKDWFPAKKSEWIKNNLK